MSRRLRRVAIITVALGLVAAVAVAWLIHRGGRADEVSTGEALAAAALSADVRTPPGAPAAGVYRFRQTGTESGGIGPVTLDRELPPRAPYVVVPHEDGYDEQLHLADQHVEGLRLRLDREGRRAIERRTHVTFAGVGRDDRRQLTPPPLHLPATLPSGSAWRTAYAAGDLTIRARGEVVARRDLTVEGVAHPVVVVRIVGDTEGAHHGRRTDTIWWSQEHNLPLRWRITMRLRGVVRLDTETDLRLESLTPRR